MHPHFDALQIVIWLHMAAATSLADLFGLQAELLAAHGHPCLESFVKNLQDGHDGGARRALGHQRHPGREHGAKRVRWCRIAAKSCQTTIGLTSAFSKAAKTEGITHVISLPR